MQLRSEEGQHLQTSLARSSPRSCSLLLWSLHGRAPFYPGGCKHQTRPLAGHISCSRNILEEIWPWLCQGVIQSPATLQSPGQQGQSLLPICRATVSTVEVCVTIPFARDQYRPHWPGLTHPCSYLLQDEVQDTALSNSLE